MPKRFKELSNQDLDAYFAGNRDYHSCISKNQIDQSLNGKFCVVNMQDSGAGQGTHWTLLYDVRPDECIYFDSMGQVPPKKVKDFMRKTKKYVIYNPLQLQALGSIVCGYWCEMIADLLNKGESMQQIIAHFSSSSPKHNDQLIKKYFSS